MTQGEIIDSMTMDKILHHPDFSSLRIEKGISYESPDYWEITFESNRRNIPKDTWLTFNNM